MVKYSFFLKSMPDSLPDPKIIFLDPHTGTASVVDKRREKGRGTGKLFRILPYIATNIFLVASTHGNTTTP
jgi:hypothetical protein